jgi:hypothetical protein
MFKRCFFIKGSIFLLLFFVFISGYSSYKKTDYVVFTVNDIPVTLSEVKCYMLLETGNCDIQKLDKTLFNSIVDFEKVYYIVTKYSRFSFSKKKFKLASYLLDDFYRIDNIFLKQNDIDKKILDNVLYRYITVSSFFDVMYSGGYNKTSVKDFLNSSSANISVNILKIK